jgi:hypothetical protein
VQIIQIDKKFEGMRALERVRSLPSWLKQTGTREPHFSAKKQFVSPMFNQQKQKGLTNNKLASLSVLC